MSQETNRARYILPKLSWGNYNTLMKLISPELSDPAKFRLHVLNHYYKFGYKSAVDAFGVKKSTLYDWKRSYEQRGKNVIGIIPKSTRPHQTRTMSTDARLIEFIKSMRLEYGNIGQNMIKPFLDQYAKKLGISTIGLTTIAKLIKRRHLTFEKRIHVKRKFKFKKLRTRKSPKVNQPGFIQMDSITVYINEERHLFMSVIDIYTKYALVEYVDGLTAKNAKEVFIKFKNINPTKITTIQTDNGSEFLSEFNEYLEQQNIKHEFIYPRSPKINGVVERFNRTIQEEFLARQDEITYNKSLFNQKLTNYLIWYNTKRPHQSLNYMTPQSYLNTFPKCM